ncbi:hypothetical protein N9937_01925 [bacterium]|nr:hypothetical protein [bacterium]
MSISNRDSLSILNRLFKVAATAKSVLQGLTKQQSQEVLGVSRKNWIINGDMQVSQRGDYTSATAATNAVYYLDRWKTTVVTVTCTVQDVGGAIRYVGTAGTGTFGTYYAVEDYASLAGKTVTLSLDMTSNTATAGITLYDGSSHLGVTHHTGSGNKETLILTVTVPPTAAALTVYPKLHGATGGGNVSVLAGDYIEFTNVKLEIGDTATPFEVEPYAEVLRKCQRYYYAHISGVNGKYLANCSYYSSTQIQAYIPFPVTMRAVPTLNSTSGASYYTVDYNSTTDAFNSLLITGASTTGAGVYNATEISGTVGFSGLLKTNSTSASVAFEAEL